MPTRDLLLKLGGYHLEERGVTSLKGKGEQLTFWLKVKRAKTKSLFRILTARQALVRYIFCSIKCILFLFFKVKARAIFQGEDGERRRRSAALAKGKRRSLLPSTLDLLR